MSKNSCILAIDQGTTGSTALLFDRKGRPRGRGYREFPQHYPKPGWVEHDPRDIIRVSVRAVGEALKNAGLSGKDIVAVGITNQRETTVVWDRRTGEPVYNAIVWQCRRTAGMCDALREKGHEDFVRSRTGLTLDAYFSATKIAWILKHVPGVRARARKGELAFGTIDSWLLWNLTKERRHFTDVTNASRTLLFDIHRRVWDAELLDLFRIPENMLPVVMPSGGLFGHTRRAGSLPAGIPVTGMAGDQQAALFGQACFDPGDVKNTYGTGCFMLQVLGKRPAEIPPGLLLTLAVGRGGMPAYALEGSVFVAGAAVQWLRDGLGIIQHAAETERLARSVPDTGGVHLVPAFAGLGAPYWDQDARGALLGLTRGSTRAHVVRATLEGIAFQSAELLEAFREGSSTRPRELKVDGGACENGFLMQFQADVLGVRVARSRVRETTALGAACLAGLSVEFWSDEKEIERWWKADRVFTPTMKPGERRARMRGWKQAVERVRGNLGAAKTGTPR